MDKISIVVPCYNEQASLPLFYHSICAVADQMFGQLFEVIFVDDGSTDGTLEIIKDYTEIDDRVRFISFSRNFGKEAALFAGLKAATGDYVAVMDVDMQDPPIMLPEMYICVSDGEYDTVATRRVSRKGEPMIRSFFARCFYRVINRMSKTDIVDGARDFRMMNRKVVDAILSVGEYNRFSKGIFGWVGFKTKWIEYTNVNRAAGETKWSFWKLLCYAFEGITAFSTAPLQIASVMGLLFCILAFVMICVIVVRTLIWGDPVSGWPSMISILLFVGGIQLFCMGIIGQYLSKTYLETKKRPIYIIDETSEDECL